MSIQPEFRPLAECTAERCKDLLGENYAAAYLHGSLYMGDAVCGVSDLDVYLVTKTPVNEVLRQRILKLEDVLLQEFPVVSEVHLALHDEAALRDDAFARFVLRYNAMLLGGEDIVRRLEERGAARIYPDAAMAKGRLVFARSCFQDALAGKQPACTGPVPKEPCWAARKFARYFVVVEGAYFLMTRGKFTAFTAEAVLPGLREEAPDFGEALLLAERVLRDAKSANLSGEDFLRRIQPFAEWMFRCMEKSDGGKI